LVDAVNAADLIVVVVFGNYLNACANGCWIHIKLNFVGFGFEGDAGIEHFVLEPR
jgi:hypothetical protein